MILWDLPQLEPGKVSEPGPVDLPYVELALDPATGDIAFPPRWLRGGEAVAQRVRVRFKFFAGEWFLDRRLGVPYYRDILIKNPDRLVVSAVFRKVLTLTLGVQKVNAFSAVLETLTRTLTADFDASLSDGTKIVATAEPFILS